MSGYTIDIKKSTYERLSFLKKEDETIDDLIERLIKERDADYSDFNGLLSNRTIKSIKELREERKKIEKF
ncbi:MAG: DUF7557 family protein [Thermoplasmatota archaeon]